MLQFQLKQQEENILKMLKVNIALNDFQDFQHTIVKGEARQCQRQG
jgi:hypothetical protein